LGDLYDRLAVDRSKLSAYRLYRNVLAGTAVMPPPHDNPSKTPDTPSTPDSPGSTVDNSGSTVDSCSRRPQQFDTAVAFIPYWRNYYHWTMEFLPKVRLLEQYQASTDRKPTVILPAAAPQWMYETLRLAGWDPDDCVEWTETTAHVDRLVVPFHRN